MKKTGVIVLTLVCLLCLGGFIYKYVAPTYTDTYSLKGDYVPSLKKVLKETKWVSIYEKGSKNGIYSKKYVYKKQENVIHSLTIYTNYLIQMEQFEVLQEYDLKDSQNTTIYLGKKSHVDSKKIILVEISYTTETITIILTKKKGSFIE